MDNRGATLVEVITAIAILAIIGSMIGGIIFISLKVYSAGNDEVEIQKEAQLAIDRISIMVRNANEIKYGYYENGNLIEALNEEDITSSKKDRLLTIIDRKGGTLSRISG